VASASFNGETLHTGVVKGDVQVSKCRNRLLDHRLHLSFIGDIAADGNRLMAGSDQALGGCSYYRFIDVNERATAAASAANACAAARPIPEPAPVTSATLSLRNKSIK
jgi:hypothetical protein